MDVVLGFQGVHRFLSNFYPCLVEFDGIKFKRKNASGGVTLASATGSATTSHNAGKDGWIL